MQMFDHTVDMTKDTARPFFYEGSDVDPIATKNNGGVPVFMPIVKVRIKIPGSRDEVDRPVEPADKQRWPRQWEQFEKGLKQQLDGIPLSEFATATEAERQTLAQIDCQTVEQVAGLNDDIASRLRLRSLKLKAEKFLQIRREIGQTAKLLSEIETLKKRIGELESGKNTEAVVSGSDEGDGVQPAEHVPVESRARRKKAGGAGQ